MRTSIVRNPTVSCAGSLQRNRRGAISRAAGMSAHGIACAYGVTAVTAWPAATRLPECFFVKVGDRYAAIRVMHLRRSRPAWVVSFVTPGWRLRRCSISHRRCPRAQEYAATSPLQGGCPDDELDARVCAPGACQVWIG